MSNNIEISNNSEDESLDNLINFTICCIDSITYNDKNNYRDFNNIKSSIDLDNMKNAMIEIDSNNIKQNIKNS